MFDAAGRAGEDALGLMVGLTAQRLTRAARAHVPKPTRRSACTHVSRAVQAARRSAVLTSRAGSAGGPKPGRAGFYLELGRFGIPCACMTSAPAPKAFVIMPFAPPFAAIFHDVIKPALAGYDVFRADSRLDERGILEKIVSGIAESDLVVADVTATNPNVMYELGIAHALGKPTVMVAQSVLDLPFDIRSYPVHEYSADVSANAVALSHLEDLARRHRQGLVTFSNPVTDFLPELSQPDESANAIESGSYSIEECASDMEWSSDQIASFFERFNSLLATHSDDLTAATSMIQAEGRNRRGSMANSAAIGRVADVTRQFALDLNELSDDFHLTWERFSRAMLWMLAPKQRERLQQDAIQRFAVHARQYDERLNEILVQLAELHHGSTLFPDWSGNVNHAMSTERDAISRLLNEIMTAKAHLARISKAAS